MLIKVKKYLFYGVKNDVELFFEQAQKKGFIEFIKKDSKKKLPTSLYHYVNAMKILKEFPIKEIKDLSLSHEEVCEKVVQLKNNIEHLKELQKNVLDEISIVRGFGNFSYEELQSIEKDTKRVFQFFVKKTSKKEAIFEDMIYVNTEYDLDYFITINKERKIYKGYVEIDVKIPINTLKKRLISINQQIDNAYNKLKTFTPYLDKLKEGFLFQLNNYNLSEAKLSISNKLEGKMFSIEAYVPKNKEKQLKELIKDFKIDCAKISSDKDEKIPTHFQNGKFAKMGEDIVKIYDVPSTRDKDPSIWILVAFSIFFAMIISDAGYGFLYLILAIFLKFKIKKPKPNIKRFISLIFLLAFSCIVWGTITTSFFGIDIKSTSPLSKVSVLNYLSEKKASYHLQKKDDVYMSWQHNYPDISTANTGKEFLSITKNETLEVFNKNILLEISLLIGTIHIILSFLHNLKRNKAGLGWICFLIGGYLYFPSILQATTTVNFLNILSKSVAYTAGIYLIYIGIALAVIISLIQNKKEGIIEITKIIGIFGDVLSYLRLYALGIAGMILSQTFNKIGLSLNIFAGVFVIILGHGVNMALGIIGGVIHGLRLNFLEWYNHCFKGGGKLFNPLKLFK